MCRRRRLSLRTLLVLLILVLIASIIVLSLILAQSLIDQFVPKKINNKRFMDRQGIQVVVGKYVGSSLDSSTYPNFTSNELNEHQFDPISKNGHNGEPVFLSERQNVVAKRLWHLHKFNVMVSDSIPLERILPDVRHRSCKEMEYEELDVASVIVVFHNEAWSTLLRTVHSVVLNSEEKLVKEIILVDDASDRNYLKQQLDQHINEKLRPKHTQIDFHILRLDVRSGLVQARLRGTSKATSPILVFLDAHCETTRGWLPPLLHHVQNNPESVACPVIDVIDDNHFGYVKSFALHWGAFNWHLHFRWFSMSKTLINDFALMPNKAYPTPVMAGGLFAISKFLFDDLGRYDEKLFLWGGENLELSFKIWRCRPKGSVMILPCSHVGHVFRKASPYEFAGGVANVLNVNLARVANVWTDNHLNFFSNINNRLIINDTTSIKPLIKLKERLRCRSMQWYLEHVWPQHFLPDTNRRFGQLELSSSSLCLQRPMSPQESSSGPALLSSCSSNYSNLLQLFVMEDEGKIRSDENLCLDAPTETKEGSVRVQSCVEDFERQMWKFAENGQIVQKKSQFCLTAAKGATSDHLVLDDCGLEESNGQIWRINEVEWQ